MSLIVCPRCGATARRQCTRYGVRHSCCDVWSWNGKPLVDAATYAARRAAHEAFDPVWRSGRMSRSAAYRRLADALEIPAADCHMSIMSAEVARRVPAIVEAWFDGVVS